MTTTTIFRVVYSLYGGIHVTVECPSLDEALREYYDMDSYDVEACAIFADDKLIKGIYLG